VLLCTACGVDRTQVAPESAGSPAPPAGSPALTSTAAPSATPTSLPVKIIPTGTARPPASNFTESFDETPPYWTSAQVDNAQPFTGPATRDGFLVFDLTGPNQWAYAFYSGHIYGDSTMEAQVQIRTSGDGAVGLVCRYDEHKGWYEFNIYADQTYQLLFGQWLAPGVARYTPLYRDHSPAIKGDADQIGLDCTGDALSPSINGVSIRRWLDRKFLLEKGQVGLSVSSFADAPFTVAIDTVTVSEP
jgi:hypothetical protein